MSWRYQMMKKGKKSSQMSENFSPPDHLKHTHEYDIQLASGLLWEDRPLRVEGAATQKVGQ